MGLKDSEHISEILIDPRNSDVVYAASQGPLWRKGGDRGLYKTTDGGATWSNVLEISEHTGVSDIAFDPTNPDIIYATSYQRRRHVWTLINGGPESSIYKSTDAGATWNKIDKGLPSVDLGRIGIDVAPSNGNILYAIVEAADGNSGFYVPSMPEQAGTNKAVMCLAVHSIIKRLWWILKMKTESHIRYLFDDL